MSINSANRRASIPSEKEDNLYGCINRAVPATEIEDFVRALAHRIGRFPARATLP